MQVKRTRKPSKKADHATRRDIRGRDRRAEKRSDQESLTILLHPALFETGQVAA